MDGNEALMLSGIQHYAFCPRQWALIHIEQQWADNGHTVDGDIFHSRTHNENQSELRGDVLTIRGLRVRSSRLNISGICDVVEFHHYEDGVPIFGRPGRWRVYPVEYKKGAPKSNQADELQLCAQALCLEEMLVCRIPEGSLFYGETRRRTKVVFTDDLRNQVEKCLSEMNQLMKRGHTPHLKPHKGCSACSLRDLCLPKMNQTGSVKDYVAAHLTQTGEQT